MSGCQILQILKSLRPGSYLSPVYLITIRVSGHGSGFDETKTWYQTIDQTECSFSAIPSQVLNELITQIHQLRTCDTQRWREDNSHFYTNFTRAITQHPA